MYEAAHAELDELLPGDGALFERRQAWRTRYQCPGDRTVAVLADLVPFMRARTLALVDLPEGERLEVEPVTDEPWWAFNYYQGDLESRVVLNTDVPTGATDLIHLTAHEVYPGHHTEHVAQGAAPPARPRPDRGGHPARADAAGGAQRRDRRGGRGDRPRRRGA